MATHQPLADLSNLGGGAAAAAGASAIDGVDVPGASTQAALDRLLGCSGDAGVGTVTSNVDGGHSGWQPRGRAGLAAKAVASSKPSAKRNSNAAAVVANAAAAAATTTAAAADAGAEADDDASPPSSEGRTRDAGATPPMRIGHAIGGAAGEEGKGDDGVGDDDDVYGPNGRNDDDDDDDDDRNDENGHESSSSGPCQLPPLAARSAIVKRRMAAAANRVRKRGDKKGRFSFFRCFFQLRFFSSLFFSFLTSRSP